MVTLGSPPSTFHKWEAPPGSWQRKGTEDKTSVDVVMFWHVTKNKGLMANSLRLVTNISPSKIRNILGYVAISRTWISLISHGFSHENLQF